MSTFTRPAYRAGWLFGLILALMGANLVIASPAAAATRDIRVHLTNNSDSVLLFDGGTLDHGCWGEKPPDVIEIDQTVDIASESCGVATGTEFTIKYRLKNAPHLQLTLHYNNPFVGSDDFDETAPLGYKVSSGGVVENRSVTFGCDSACDGIPLDWKKNGVTIDPGGGNPPQFVDLPKMGVSLDRPNIFVQLDWMEDATHNQQLRQAALDTVINAFDQDPVTHRGATRPGITLVIDAGPDSTITPGGAKWGALSQAKKIPWTKFLLTGNRDDGYQTANFYTLLKSNFVPTGRLPIFHYSVAADTIAQDTRPMPPVDDDTSGLATGDKLGFMVTLGRWNSGTNGTQNEQTGTFMHELGHVLGLDHGATEGGGDAVNWKPNYPSVMSYAYQTRGVFRGGAQVFDYSRDTMPDLDESTLTESGGADLGANPSGYGTVHRCKTKDAAGNDVFNVFVQADLKPVDWSCDGTTPNGATGFDSNADGAQTILKGSTSDWSRIDFTTGGVGAGLNAKDTVTIPSSGVSAPHQELTYTQDQRTRVLPLDTELTYTGVTSGDYHDTAVMSATLVDPEDGDSPIPDETVTFRIGSSVTDTCSATTSSSGVASCGIRLTQAPGSYAVTASFAGDAVYKADTDSSTFTITREETTLTFTGPTVVLAGSTSTTVSALLVEGGANETDGDGSSAAPDPYGQTVTFTLGTQSCDGVTDATGVASCSIPGVSGDTLGPKTLTAAFAGDTYYEPSSDATEVIVFAFPDRGAFVLGDSTVAAATAETSVTWWSHDWSLRNALSGGIAPFAFKGFAADVSTLPTTTPADSCGTSFVTSSGNSAPPVSDVPEYMGVVVASSVTKTGANVNGVWGRVVVVKTDPGYAQNPGHPGTGQIVATFCP
jgi:hypothetical protein